MARDFKSEYDLRAFQVVDAKFPEHGKYQILVFSTDSVFHEGDERSRTNPGHGYPAYTETVHRVDVFAFTNEGDWHAAIEMFYRANPKRKDIVAQVIDKVASIAIEARISVSVA